MRSDFTDTELTTVYDNEARRMDALMSERLSA